MGQSPLAKTLNTLCADIEQHNPGILCSCCSWTSDLVDDKAAVLQKPFPLETLARKVRSLFDE